ncbi:uncharacterized protein [Linepithema humile]|uniref:uncharacterized protein n=1 Tax=Linepithema humile TaxID=83485 RepID=UPI0006236BFE|nr:PREDICTED: uncharacterized protein LOC105671729 [Linepithema humile]
MEAQTNKQDNSNQYEYVTLLKNNCDQSLFPNDFDMWTVSEQYNWINNNLSKFFPNVPKSLLGFVPAMFCRGDYSRWPEIPEWLDVDKYRRGQKFVHDYTYAIVTSILFSILHAYSFENGLNPIILGGQSHTPYLSYKRYQSTVRRMTNWYTGEPWVEDTPAHKDMQFTRKLHKMIRAKLSQISKDKIDAACIFANPWCPDRESLLKDFAAACPFEKVGQRPYKFFTELLEQKHLNDLNDFELIMGQCSFIGLIVLYPKEFGVHNATDEDLEAFCHMWRCYGYYLGIADEHNFCRGSLGEIKQRIRDIYQYWVLPNFKEITPEWEHVTRCIVETFNYNYNVRVLPYKIVVLLATEPLGINMSHLYASLCYSEWIVYYCWKFLLRYAMMLKIVRSFLNGVLQKSLYKEESPERHAEFYERSKKQVPDFSITF